MILIFSFIRFFLKLFLLTAIFLPLALIAFSISDQALVAQPEEPSHYDIARVKQILKRHDPRYLKQGQSGYVNLSEIDLNTLLLTSFSPIKEVRLKSHLTSNHIKLQFSYVLPDNAYGKYANLSLVFENTGERFIQVQQMQFGELTIPGQFVRPVFRLINKLLYRDTDYQRLVDAIHLIKIQKQQLHIRYQADWRIIQQLKHHGQRFLISEAEQYRINLYQNKLFQVLEDKNKKPYSQRSFQLNEILQAMFQYAYERSSSEKNDSVSTVEENKSLLFVLAMYSTNKTLDSILGQSVTRTMKTRKKWRPATLQNRIDLMQHFTVSAFLASRTDNALAHATGLYKEMSDSRGGSGFSFADLAADRAGVEFGSLAVASEQSALKLQQLVSQGLEEKDFMPDTTNLPEQLQESRFKQLYGSTEDKRYQLMQDELDRRIKLCRLYTSN